MLDKSARGGGNMGITKVINIKNRHKERNKHYVKNY